MSGFRRLLFGSKLRALATVLLLLGATVGAAFAVGVLGTPSVVGVENRFGEVTDEETIVETDLVVHNPNPIGVSLGGTTVNYTVAMNDVRIANGTREGLAVETGNTTLEFTTTMANRKIPAWWASHVRNGERTQVELDARVHSSLIGQSVSIPHSQTVETDVIGQFNSTETRPVNASQPVVSDPVLYVNRTGAAWGEVTRSATPIHTEFVVYNPKPAPYTVTEVGYEITMNDLQVGEGTTEEPYVVQSGTETTIRTTTAIRNAALDDWWVSHLENDQVTELRIEFYARVELPTGNTVRVPLDGVTYTEEIETDIFGTKDGGSDGESSETTDGEPSGDGTATATPTATPSSTPGGGDATTATTTDDDGPILGGGDGTTTDGGILSRLAGARDLGPA